MVSKLGPLFEPFEPFEPTLQNIKRDAEGQQLEGLTRCSSQLRLTNGSADDMLVGAEMTFDIEDDERSGRTRATNVTITKPGTGEPGGGKKGRMD